MVVGFNGDIVLIGGRPFCWFDIILKYEVSVCDVIDEMRGLLQIDTHTSVLTNESRKQPINYINDSYYYNDINQQSHKYTSMFMVLNWYSIS